MFDVLGRISELRNERGWSHYRLAQNAGIPKSSLFTWYSRNVAPPIDVIENICEAFGITLSEFFEEKKREMGETNLEKLRTKAGMSLDELAEKACIPVEVISAFEQRKIDIKGASYSTIEKIAAALDCPMKSIVEDPGE